MEELIFTNNLKSLPKDIMKKMKSKARARNKCSQNIVLKKGWYPASQMISCNSITKLAATWWKRARDAGRRFTKEDTGTGSRSMNTSCSFRTPTTPLQRKRPKTPDVGGNEKNSALSRARGGGGGSVRTILEQYIAVSFQKTCMQRLYDPVIPLLGIYPRSGSGSSQKDLYEDSHRSSVCNERNPGKAQVTINKRIYKQAVR